MLVSAIIPVFNGERFLAEAIDSALAQTHEELEVIVVDDGSTDGSPAVIASYGNRIRSFRQENRGVAAARNRALAEARGTYVAMLDQDDVWLPHKTSVQLEAFARSPEAVLVWTGHKTSDPRRSSQGRTHSANDLLFGCGIGCVTVMVRRDTLLALGGFDERAPPCDDWDAWIRVSRVGPMHYVPEDLAVWRMHDQQVSRNRRAMWIGDVYVLRKHEALFADLADGPTVHRNQVAIRFANIARACLNDGDARGARSFAVEALAAARGARIRFHCVRLLVRALATRSRDA